MAWWWGVALDQLRRSAENALDQLKDAFWQLDSSQRFARAQVQAYAEHLPERAKRSGLQARFLVVDEKTEQYVAEYLAVIDRFPMEPKMRERTLAAAQQAFRHLEPLLRAVTEELDGFVTSHSAELALVGEQLRKVDEQKRLAREAAESAEAQWEKLRKDGLGSAFAESALTNLRAAIQGVDAWDPAAGVAELEEMADVARGFAADLRKIAIEYPRQIERVRHRVPSLRTRIDAITTRTAGIASCLGDLRREFSLGNWKDLDGQDQLVAKELATARMLVDRLQESISSESWEEALTLLTEVESTLARADDAVDAPRERLAVLRDFRADPEARLDRTRFVIKDAQRMVVSGPVRNTTDIASRLDGLALRLDRVRPALEGLHPNYWSILTDVDEIERQVREVVARYRHRVR